MFFLPFLAPGAVVPQPAPVLSGVVGFTNAVPSSAQDAEQRQHAQNASQNHDRSVHHLLSLELDWFFYS
jgi:hypothetical protein